MVTFNLSKCLFYLNLFLFLFAPYAKSDTEEIKRTVKDLGRSDNSIEKVKALSQHSEQVIPLLIKELHTLKETRIMRQETNPEVGHILWCIRALRFMTGGMDFCAPTKHRFGKSDLEKQRKYWLQFRHGECLNFFALWPSHVSTYIAPLDAQEMIIEKWKSWYKSEVKPSYQPLQNPKPEEWLW
jgi:hypothetical protein